MAQARDYYNYQRDTIPAAGTWISCRRRAFQHRSVPQPSSDLKPPPTPVVAFGISQQQNQRAMASMGANPNSGRFAGMQNATGLQQAAMRANAMTGARNQAQQMGYARKLDAAGLGRGLAGALSLPTAARTKLVLWLARNAQSAGQELHGQYGYRLWHHRGGSDRCSLAV